MNPENSSFINDTILSTFALFNFSMQGIINFIKDFHKNSGSWIMSATLFNKLILFLIKVFVIIYIEKEVLGQVVYSITMIAFFTPFVGFGSPAGLLRYGSIAESDEERREVIDYSFSQGLVNTFILILLIVPFLSFLSKGEEATMLFLCILLGRVLALFLNNHQSAQMRVDFQNKRYGQYDMMNSITLFVLAFALTYLFQAVGYVVSLVIAPILTFIIYSILYGAPKFNLKWNFNFPKKSYWIYAMLTSFSGVVSQMVFFVDIYLIRDMIDNEAVAEYNVAGLIPLNVLVLPVIFMRTDFTKIASNYKNRAFLKNYYINYLYLFLAISIAGMLVSYFLGEWLFSFIGEDYQPFEIFMYLMAAVCISIMFRVPLGNMISAFGKARFNTISGVITLVFAVVLNFLFIPKYGLLGATWATCISLIISSVLNLAYFIWYLKYECE